MIDSPFQTDFLPVMPLKDMVLLPGAISPLYLVRGFSLEALEDALAGDKRLFVVCQKDPDIDDPSADDLHEVGVVAEVLQVLRSPDGASKVLVEAQHAARAVQVTEREGRMKAFVVRVQLQPGEKSDIRTLRRAASRSFSRYIELSGKASTDLDAQVRGIKDPLAYLYAMANNILLKTEEKQELLASQSLEEKYILFNQFLEAENQLLELETKIDGQVRAQIGANQREFYLNEQLKAIERELGMGSEEDVELRALAEAIEEAGMPDDARDKAERELQRLARMAPMSPEAAVLRTYLEWMVDVPWSNTSEDVLDLQRARRILDRDHHGLEKVKQRILEYLAVVKLAGQARGPILCFVGPPGVGKTSLGRSIARCVGREFVRISLGGVRDEAEIRGHRRTYVGALPGKIIQSMKRAGTMNPVFLLDEVDKMSSDFRGDPASAMLEVLDPEQNKTFNDHYLEADYDLSRVMFITTANSMDRIPYPLLDRMELIRIPGYTDEEKAQIARKHLMPRLRKEHGLPAARVKMSKTVLHQVITGYTRESGVRNLERCLAQVCRKAAVEMVENPRAKPRAVTRDRLREFLGPQKFVDHPQEAKPEVGTCTGLAWTETGGEILPVETTLMKGKGNLILTGKLGEVMQESAKTALSYIRSRAVELGIDPDFHGKIDIHIHVPEGAIPKDGPSAGITLATSLASALGALPVRQDLAMTGEVTLRGRVLKVGGIKEKVLAAHRRKILTVLIPRENLDDLEDIAPEIRSQLTIHPVERLDEVFGLALVGAGERKEGSKRAGRGQGVRASRGYPRSAPIASPRD